MPFIYESYSVVCLCTSRSRSSKPGVVAIRTSSVAFKKHKTIVKALWVSSFEPLIHESLIFVMRYIWQILMRCNQFKLCHAQLTQHSRGICIRYSSHIGRPNQSMKNTHWQVSSESEKIDGQIQEDGRNGTRGKQSHSRPICQEWWLKT